MALKFFKKQSPKPPTPNQPCEHQIPVTNISDSVLESSCFERQAPEEKIDEGSQIQDNVGQSNSHEIPPCDACKEERKRMNRYRWKLVIGLFLPFLVQSLDSTIISAALPFIASDFHQLSQLNWIVSAFNLTFATFIPFWGQFADVFGRFAAIQFALLTMLLGSVICSAAPVTAFSLFLVGRGLQGIGCAGLLIAPKIVLADKVSLQENARNNTLFTIIVGIGYGNGPLIGGYLTQANWRWCFIINIPLGVLGLVISHVVLRPELLGPQNITLHDDSTVDSDLSQTFAARISTIDYGGQVLFLFGLGMFILALTWAGSSYGWTNVKVLAPLIIGICLILLFFVWEYFMIPGSLLATHAPTRKAMVPLKLLFTRNAGLLIYINFTTGMAMYSVFYFVDFYFALVKGYAANKAGRNLLFYLPGLGAGAYMAIFACNVWPMQTIPPLLLGTIIEPLGINILAFAINTNNLPLIYSMMVFSGVGTGLRVMPGTLHGVAYFPTQIASIVSLMSLAVSLGGVFATTIMLNIFNASLARAGVHFDSVTSSSLEAIRALPAGQQSFLRVEARRGIALAFFAITAFMWLGVVACIGLGNVKIAKKGNGNNGDVVTKGSFIANKLCMKEREE